MATKCPICERKPRHQGGYCRTCASKIESERKVRQSPKAEKFVTFRGFVMGLFPNGGGKLRPKLLKRDPEKLPKRRTINLNVFCPGFERWQIRKMKAAILGLAS